MITPELLAQVRRLTIRSRRAVEEVFAGAYRSAFRGKGLGQVLLSRVSSAFQEGTLTRILATISTPNLPASMMRSRIPEERGFLYNQEMLGACE